MICAVLDVWFNALTLCFKLKSFSTFGVRRWVGGVDISCLCCEPACKRPSLWRMVSAKPDLRLPYIASEHHWLSNHYITKPHQRLHIGVSWSEPWKNSTWPMFSSVKIAKLQIEIKSIAYFEALQYRQDSEICRMHTSTYLIHYHKKTHFPICTHCSENQSQ